MSNRVPVVVLKLGPLPFHPGSIGIVRTLGRLGVPVYVFEDSRWAPGVFSRFSGGYLTGNLGEVDAAEGLQCLLRIGRELDGGAILIPIDDAGCVFVADHADALRTEFVFPDQPTGLARRLASKKELYFLCRKMGVPTPESAFPQSRADVIEFLERATFPVALKVNDPGVARRDLNLGSVAIVKDAKQLLRAYDQMEQPGNPNLLLQEYIPGTPDSVWMFNGYFDRNSECLMGITARKLRQFPAYTGATSLGVCQRNETVEGATKSFMKLVGYRGILDMGYRFDHRDGQYKVLDVNPRIGATFRLFEDTARLDVARAMYLDLTGQQFSAGAPQEGRKWIVENYDLISSLRYLWDGQLTPRQWLSSLRDIEEAVWFAPDDLSPFLVMCLSFVPVGIVRSVQRRRTAARAPSRPRSCSLP